MTDLDCKQTEKLIPQFLKDELDNRTEKKFLNHVMLLILHFAMEMIIGRMKHAFKRNMIFWKSM